MAELKDNINTMIDNLRLTTDRNTEQDWLKTNLARFTGMLQGQRDLTTVGRMLLSELAPLVADERPSRNPRRTPDSFRFIVARANCRVGWMPVRGR